jgi:FMN phosphatase YigB (HAD superfamily)
VLATGARVLSVDVFDTLLWRAVPEPVDAFALVGDAQAAAGHLAVPAEGFPALRERAEAMARERGTRERGSSEVSLEEVYAELPSAVVGASSPAELAEVEVAVEASLTFPDLAVVDLARSLERDHGVRIVLVSNTYFSSTQLRRLLQREQFDDLPLHAVFTSSERRVHKGSGLYDVVLGALGVRGCEVVHLGDDAEADGAAAERAGLHAVLLPRRPAPLPEVLAKEGFPGGNAVARRRAPSIGGGRDGGLTAIRAKTLRRDDAPAADGRQRTCWNTGAAVLGPVFTGFAEWVHARAAASATGELFCLMREGAFLARLLDSAGGPRVSTLWTSRFVCAQAAIVDVSLAELETFLARRRVPTLADAATGLGLRPSQLGPLDALSSARLDDPQMRIAFLDAVTGNEELRAVVANHCAQVRQRLVQHVLDTAGRDEGELLLVDVGWGASIQTLLDRALGAEKVNLRTRGFYLMTNDAATGRVLSGVAAEGYLGNLGSPQPLVRWVTRSPEVLEQLCMPDVGSLQGFDDQSVPVPARDLVAPAQQAERRAVQDGILAFQDEWRRYAPVVRSQPLLYEQRPMLRTILLRFIADPTLDEAAVLGSWKHDENQGSSAVETVLTGFPPELLRYLSPMQLLELPMTRLYWPFALAALYNPPLARAAAAVALGELPAEMFTSGTDTTMTLYVDYGCGSLPRRQSALQANSQGLSYLRFALDAHPVYAVGVGFPAGPGLVRLDWLRLRFAVRGRPDEVVVEIRWPEGHESLRYHDGVLVAGNILHGAARAPRLSFRCPDDWNGEVYHAEVEIGFAWLPAAAHQSPARDRAAVALDLARRMKPRARAVFRLGQILARRLRAVA